MISKELRKRAKDLLKLSEGFSPSVYKCPANYNTIGYGRNLDTNPLTHREIDALKTMGVDPNHLKINEDQAAYLLNDDIDRVAGQLEKESFWSKLTDSQKVAVIDMSFNIGVSGFLRFKRLIKALEAQDKEGIIKAVKDSKYYTQVKSRADRNIKLFTEGL